MSLEKTKELLVLDYYLTRNENEVSKIADYVGISEYRVNKIINKYLKNKIPNE